MRNQAYSILIVDDEEDIREILMFNLENEGYLIDTAKSAKEALQKLSPSHDLILLDVMMEEGLSGFKLASQLRKEGNTTPIIFLTAKHAENDILTGFSIGADDYIYKPFSIKQLIARVKSVLKRSYPAGKKEENNSVIEIENLKLDLNAMQVYINNELIELTKTEFNILLFLVQNEAKVFSRADILSRAWDNEGVVLDRTVDVHITRLRKKLGKYGSCIQSRSKYGYLFNPNAKEENAQTQL